MSAQGAKQCLGLSEYPKTDNENGWEQLHSYVALLIDFYDKFTETHSDQYFEGIGEAAKALVALTDEALKIKKEKERGGFLH